MHKIAYLETIYMILPVETIKTKGAPNKFKSTPSDNSTKQPPSFLEHVY